LQFSVVRLFAPPQVRQALAQFVQRQKAFLIGGEQAIDALADANEIAAESLLTAFGRVGFSRSCEPSVEFVMDEFGIFEQPHDFRPNNPVQKILTHWAVVANGAGKSPPGAISPLLSNLYLTEVDRMLERAKETTRCGKYTYIEYARFADDLVILIDAYPRHDWLLGAVEKRIREELADLQVEINEEKSRIVDLGRGESFGFLGFDFRRIRSRRGAWRANYTPKLKKRTALLRKLKDVFRRYQSQPVDRVVQLINPMLRGWVNYFAVGHSSVCFSFIKDWVEKKVRRHMLRAQKRKGFGWTRWSRPWLYETLKLFNSYRVWRSEPKVAPAG
jgi:RNA-directed DNA polymerase